MIVHFREEFFLKKLFPLIFLTVLFLFPPSIHSSAASSKEEVLAKYEKVMDRIESEEMKPDLAAEAAKRMARIHEALSRNDYDQADSLLRKMVLTEDRYDKNRQVSPTLNKEIKLYWLELYLDLFQKFAVLALLAFLLVRHSFWRSALKTGTIPVLTKVVLTVSAVFFSGIFHVLDLSRYGESGFGIFDVQTVFAAIAGLLGGTFWGIVGGFLMVCIRWALHPGNGAASVVVLVAAILGGTFSVGLKNYSHSTRRAFFCGMAAGLFHGGMVYGRLLSTLSPTDVVFSILAVTFFEAVGVAVFFAVISAVLQEDLKKDTEQELLRTQMLFLQAQLTPHFLFNALNTIATVCYKAGDEQGEGLVLKLSDFFRHILNRKEDRVTLREEISFIDATI